MNPPLLTYVLLSFNQQKFIREAVTSALSQTYSNLEIIISDDCSTDATYQIIEEIAAAYTGHHTIVLNRNERNIGLCAHVNQAFTMAKGEWIVAAAGDDISRADRCQKLYEATLDVPDASAITSAWIMIDENGNQVPSYIEPRYVNGRVDHLGDTKWAERFLRSNDIGTHGATAMWSRKLLQQFDKMPDNVPAEDAILSFRAYLTGSVIYLKDKLVEYRTHSTNIYTLATTNVREKEIRSRDFSKKSLATVQAIEQDYNTYLERNYNQFNVRSGLRLINWSKELQKTRSQWWDRGVLWRILHAIKAIYSGNFVEARWRAIRLGGITVTSMVKSIKRMFAKFFANSHTL